MRPKVSVSILTYNHGKWLAECLDSVLAQLTNFSFEVVVGDDASTDGVSRKVLDEYAHRYPEVVKPIFRDWNVGGNSNYFDVTARCVGDYIAYIDGDDRMLPGKLQKQADFLDGHSECSIVAHDLRVFDGRTNATISSTFRPGPMPPLIADIDFLVLSGCYFGHASKMYRRSAIITKSRNEGTIDFFLHLEHAASGKIGYIPEVLGEYRKSDKTYSDPSGEHFQQIIQAQLDAYRRALELGCEPEAVFRGKANFKYVHAMMLFHLKKYEQFRELIRLDRDEVKVAAMRHRLVAGLSRFTMLLRFASYLVKRK